MVSLFAKLFIKPEFEEEKKRTLYGVLCGVVGIILNIILFAFKFFAGIISGAVSITADAFNNLSDAGSSLVTILGFKLASQKPNRDHPYGHGRMEYISGFVVSIIIILMGFELIKSSIEKIINPEAVESSAVVMIILVFSILVKCYMSFYNSSVGKKIDSAALKATAADSLSDCIATSVVLVCTLINRFAGINLDGYAGVVVSLFIFYAGYSAAKDSLEPLLGSAPDPEFIDELEDIVINYDENILGLHDLMVHDYGPGRLIISLHAEVPAKADILEIHDIIDNLEHEIATKLNCVATIHLDPVENDNPEVVALKEKVIPLMKEIFEGITIHDFRVVFGETHTNLIFDMAVPFECKYTNDECVAMAREKIYATIGKNFHAVIEVDRENYYNR